MNGRIQRTQLSRVEARDDARLPTAWVGGAPQQATWTDGAWLTRAESRLTAGPETAVLGLLGKDSEAAQAALLALAAAGARTYALVGPAWGRSPADAELLQAPRVLVRRLPEVPASALHVGSAAQLWIGGGFVLRLASSQADGLRQTFLRLFWHEATDEAWSGGRQIEWRPARGRPFDVPELPSSAAVRLESPDARINGDAFGALMHISGGAPPEARPRRIWFPAGGDHHEALARLAQAGVEVMWADRALPDMKVGGAGGEILLPGSRGRLRVRLTGEQAPDFGRLLDAPPSWRFRVGARVGEFGHRSARFWLPGEAAARELELEQRIEVPELQASSLREVPTTAPASVPAAQPLALSVRYEWKVVPPRVPSGSEEDALVGRWRKLDADWTGGLARVREALVAAEEDRGRISRAFSGLLGAMLGFEHTHTGLLGRVRGLEARRPSAAGPSGASALLAEFAEVEEAGRSLQADLEESERKAREQEEREKQRADWQRRVASAKRELPERREALATAEDRRSALAEELGAVEESLKAAEKEARKDLTVRQRRISDDLQRLQGEVKRLQGEIAAMEQQIGESFEFRPPPAPPGRSAQTGGRFVPAAPSVRSHAAVPEEALPEVGALRSHKGQRFLVIESWEQLAAGEVAASRLQARLVAPENA